MKTNPTMKLNHNLKLSAIIASASLKSLEQPRNWLLRSCVICGLTLLPFSTMAQNQNLIVDGTAHPAETGAIYEAVSDAAALTVIGASAAGLNGSYSGTNITLSSTFNSKYSYNFGESSNGAAVNHGSLSLTGGTVTTTGSYGHGIALYDYYDDYYHVATSGTLNNVFIETQGYGSYGVYADESTLMLTGGTIRTTGSNAHGIYFYYSEGGTIKNATIVTEGWGSHGVSGELYGGGSPLVVVDSSTINSWYGDGIHLNDKDGQLSDVNITSGRYGVYAVSYTLLTLTGGTINSWSDGIYYGGNMDATVSDVKIESSFGNGVSVRDNSTMTLTDADILGGSSGVYVNSSTLMMYSSTVHTSGDGIYLNNKSYGLLNDVNITTDFASYYSGVSVDHSTLTLNSGTITALHGGNGLHLYNGSSGTVSNVSIETTGDSLFTYGYDGFSHGVILHSSTLTLTSGAIRTSGSAAYGLVINYGGSGTLSNVRIETTGKESHGVYVGTYLSYQSSANNLTLTDSDISVTGSGAYALYLEDYNSATVNLNHSALTGGIMVKNARLTLTGSNGSVITGDIIANGEDDPSTVDITLTGPGTSLHGNLSTINGNLGDSSFSLTVGAGALFVGSGTVTDLTLATGAILGYTDNGPLVIESTITIGDGILIDFSGVTVTDGEDFLVLDWHNATVSGSISETSFTATNLGAGFDGTFTVDATNGQLTFNATAVPEPSVYILLGVGLGILLITAHRRRNVQS